MSDYTSSTTTNSLQQTMARLSLQENSDSAASPTAGGSSWMTRGGTASSASATSGPLHTHTFDDPPGWSIVNNSSSKPNSSSSSASNTSPAPCPRSLHSAVYLKNAMYMFGGYDGHARVNDFDKFDFETRQWCRIPCHGDGGGGGGVSPSPRDRHTSVVHGDSVYIFGGFDGRSRVHDFFGFDTITQEWNPVRHLRGQPPSPRHSHAAAVQGNSMFVFGGYDGSYRSDLHEYNFQTSTWHIHTPTSTTTTPTTTNTHRTPRARYRATLAPLLSHYLVLFGGHDGTRHLADVHLYNVLTREWQVLKTEGVPPMPRDSHVCVVMDEDEEAFVDNEKTKQQKKKKRKDSMVVFGGSTGSAMSDLWEFQVEIQQGEGTATAAAAAAVGVVGGTASEEEVVVGTWRQITHSSSGEVPRARFCHSGIMRQGVMYIFGGYDGTSRLNDFIMFDFGDRDVSMELEPSTLQSDLKSFVNSDELSDVTFVVEGHEVYAHKFMLVRSSYFRAMFLGEMREAQQAKIPLHDVRHSIFLLILEYLYTDTLATLPPSDAMELFCAADEFCLDRLKTMCEQCMLQGMTVENAATVLLAADLHCAVKLKKKVLRFVLVHFSQVSKTAAFEEMARTNVELVFEILRNR